MNDKLSTHHQTTFEQIKQQDADGNEYWSARELAPLLEYVQWRNFMQVVDKARTACLQAGKSVTDHFADISKMVEIGSGAMPEVEDVRLSMPVT